MNEFDKLVKRILSEDYTSVNDEGWISIDQENSNIGFHLNDLDDSVGYDLDSGIVDGKIDPIEVNKASVQVVEFDQGAKQVWKHAKQHHATPEDLKQLKSALLALKKKYPPEAGVYDYITFSTDNPDVNLGVFDQS